MATSAGECWIKPPWPGKVLGRTRIQWGNAMATGQLGSVVRHLRKVALLQDGADRTDGELLECFLARREEAAFEALVQRHGPMVLGVCRRVLHNAHDAEDAFQATFLVLVRKAASIVPRELVGNWLYGVAHRTALKARGMAARRRARERPLDDPPQPPSAPPHEWDELQSVLDHELVRLPEKYRLPVVLCELEGRPRREVARRLAIPEGTLSSRLAAARRMLAQRLGRRGLPVSAVALTAVLSPRAATACVSSSLFRSTVQATAAGVLADSVPARVAALAEGAMSTMFVAKLPV